MTAPTEVKALSPLQQTAATATDIWNDSCAVDELAYAIKHGRLVPRPIRPSSTTSGRRTRRAGPPRARAGGRAARRDRDAPGVGDRRGDVARGRLAADARASSAPAGEQGRLSMQTNPTFWRSFDADARPGHPLHRGRAEHHRQVPGDHDGHRRDGGSDLPRRLDQLHGLVLRRSGGGGGRGSGARPRAARSRKACRPTTWAR